MDMEITVNRFQSLLLEENEKQNLISRRSSPEDVAVHVRDSLAVLEHVSLDKKQVLDIGSGAGFPGIVLAMACKDSRFTLVESDLKKSQFLQDACQKIAIENVTVERRRVEELGRQKEYRASFDFCTSRAVAAMNILLEYGLPLLRPGGKMLLWKGKNYASEIDESQHALEVLGGSVEDVFFYRLLEDRDRCIVVVRKDRATPDSYPRRTGIPAKRPL